jgi:hypothetical protein
MKKIAMSALTVGALGLASVATTSPAEAHWRGGWGGWGPGIAGDLVAGAVIGGLASSAYGWGPGDGYYGGAGYYGAGNYGGPYAKIMATTNPIAGAAATPRPTTRRPYPTATVIAASCARPTPITADPIRSCVNAGIATTTGETSPSKRNEGRAPKARPFSNGARLPLTNLRRTGRGVRKPADRELFSTSSSVA